MDKPGRILVCPFLHLPTMHQNYLPVALMFHRHADRSKLKNNAMQNKHSFASRKIRQQKSPPS